jgi:hypothetical protein
MRGFIVKAARQMSHLLSCGMLPDFTGDGELPPGVHVAIGLTLNGVWRFLSATIMVIVPSS